MRRAGAAIGAIGDQGETRLAKATRRSILKTTALAGAGAFAAPYVKRAYGAGQLKLGFWDHWVPGANDVFDRLAMAWAKDANVDLQIDHITHNANKIYVTMAAEAQARAGHDAMFFGTFYGPLYADQLEPVDEVVTELERQYGEVVPLGRYIGQLDGTWKLVPTSTGWQAFVMNSRLDYFRDIAGVDLLELFPVGSRDVARLDREWTWQTFLGHARKLHAAGHAFANPIGPMGDSQNWVPPLFYAFGSHPLDEKGETVLDSEATRAALAYMEELTAVMPPEIYAWDDAGNNRWLISGQGSAIMNSPSPWAVAKRDAPAVAEQIWHHDVPAGPNGRFVGASPSFWGIWEFAQNKPAAKDFLLYMLQKEQQAELIKASQGYDLPPFPAFTDNPVWIESGPPEGTLYGYPARGNSTYYIAGFPGPPKIAAQVLVQGLIPRMVARVTQEGLSHDDAIAWAEEEIEGYRRT
jgi:ABC-type glycerol-3-phosphate transport system substrate-binding protein